MRVSNPKKVGTPVTDKLLPHYRHKDRTQYLQNNVNSIATLFGHKNKTSSTAVFSYLQHIGAGAMVIASFQQTLWTVQPVSSGAVRQKSLGMIICAQHPIYSFVFSTLYS